MNLITHKLFMNISGNVIYCINWAAHVCTDAEKNNGRLEEWEGEKKHVRKETGGERRNEMRSEMK